MGAPVMRVLLCWVYTMEPQIFVLKLPGGKRCESNEIRKILNPGPQLYVAAS